MATYDSQSVNGRYIRLTVTESDLDAVNNRSKVNWNVTVYGANGTWYSSTVYLAINGSELVSTSWVDPPQGYFPMVNGTSKSGSLWVTHDASGAKSVSVVFNVRIYYYAEEAHGGTFTLTTLDRNAPTITTDTPTDITVSSASVKVNSNVTCSQWAYQIKTAGGSYGAWTYATAEASTHTFSITGLSTNTSYTVNCAGKKKANDVWGYKEVSFKTLGSATITSMSSATIGATNGLTVEWTPLDSTHQFTLQFMCNGWSYTTGWIRPASTNSYSYHYTLPMAVCNNIPNSTTGTLTAVLTTYDSNDTQIGNASTKTSTITVPSSVVPIFNSINIYEGTQSSFGVFVKTLSTVKATVNGGGAYGSTITAISMKVEGSVYNATLTTGIVESGILQTYNTSTGVPVTFTITDSRGRTATTTRYVIVYDYYPPTISATATVYGTTVTTNAQGSIAPVNNLNQKRLVITRRRIVDSGNTGTYTQNPLDAYNYNKTWTQTISDAGRETYEYVATVYDKLNSTSVTIQTGITAISRKAGGRGVTFFGEAQRDGFWIVENGEYKYQGAGSVEYIIGTQTASTGSWTGVTKDVALYDGKMIMYVLPYAGSGGATLNLTLAGGGTTGAKAIYRYGSTTQITTHYSAFSRILLIYDSANNRWNSSAWYDSKLSAMSQTEATAGTATTTRGISAKVLHNTVVNLIYPVGSIYMSVNSTSPATLFGGTWVQIQDTFLLSAGSSYTAGSTGGEATHTLTKNEMPAHGHSLNAYASSSGGSGGGVINYNNKAGGAQYIAYDQGGGQAHNNMPPYLVVYMWKRTS